MYENDRSKKWERGMRERENLTKGEEEESGGKDERKRNEG